MPSYIGIPILYLIMLGNSTFFILVYQLFFLTLIGLLCYRCSASKKKGHIMDIQKQHEYVEKYQKENIRRVVVKLNKKTDQRIIKKINSVDNVQGYIKGLILKDIDGKAKK